jgi:hypothetical protein
VFRIPAKAGERENVRSKRGRDWQKVFRMSVIGNVIT